MPRYTVKSGDVVAGAGKTLVAVLGTATRRPSVISVVIGCSTTPGADNTAQFELAIFTADGAGGAAATPQPCDGGEVASICTAKKDYAAGAGPTYVDGILIPLHQRTTVAIPIPADFKPATGAGKGIGLRMIAGPAGAVYNATLFFDE